MGEPKPTASLSGLLLARKGAARPAMRRPSSFDTDGNAAVAQDDLGWNDMGYDVDPDPNTPMDHDHNMGYNPLAGAVPDAKPEVRQQQERIAEQLQVQAEAGFESVPNINSLKKDSSEKVEQIRPAKVQALANVPFEAPAVANEVSKLTIAAPKKRATPGSKGKAAFTLRLDSERHLKLRLACTLSNRSAQMMVTEALDAFLETMPEIAQLAARVPARR